MSVRLVTVHGRFEIYKKAVLRTCASFDFATCKFVYSVDVRQYSAAVDLARLCLSDFFVSDEDFEILVLGDDSEVYGYIPGRGSLHD